MQLGMIGLGRMGANMVRRLMRGGHELVVWDINQDAVDELAGEGATGAPTLEEFVRKLDTPRPVWLMLPVAFVDNTIEINPDLSEKEILLYAARRIVQYMKARAASIRVFDPEKETAFTRGFMKSKSSNTPFLDCTLKGSVGMVVVGDEVLLER